MRADTYKKRIVLIIIVSTLFALICGVCLSLLGCGNEPISDGEPTSLDTVFCVHYQASYGGYIDGEAEQIVKYNQDASSVMAKPDEGYEFVEWSDGVKTAERRESNVQADVTVSAIFGKKKYRVKYTTDGNGVLSGTAEQEIEHGKGATTVTAIPNEGYEFIEWSDGVKTAERRESNVQADVTVSAIFGKKKYRVKYTTDGNGVLSGTAEQEIEHGNSATAVTALPNEGYVFVEWSDGVKTATRQDSIIFTDLIVKAKFQKEGYKLTYLVNNNECGTIVGDAIQYVAHGKSATTVIAIPNEGYVFVEWSDGVKTATRQDSNIFKDLIVTAKFQNKTYYKLTYLVNNNECGTIVGDAIQFVTHGESGSTIKAVPNEGYEFAYWATSSDDEQRLTAERTDNITQDTTLVAFFRRKKVTVTYNTSTGGSIYYIENNGTTIDYGGQSSVVRAEPDRNNGYVFLYWSDGLKTAERTEYNVKSDMKLIAYFGYSAEYKVNNGVGGKIVGETYQAVLPNADFSAVEAIPDKGYAFGGWSDLQTESIRQDTNAERCIEHIAYFEPIIRTFNCDYGIASGMPMESTVTINRENIILDGYPTPQIGGYTFEGWYADSDYKLKVINGDGRYMLGYYGFSLETDTLYARWKPVDVSGPAFKVLLLFVNEVEATLYPAKIDGEKEPRDVHHIMTTIDREFCAVSHSLVSKYLTEWLSDLTTVEVDAYYTTQNAGEYILYTPWKSDQYDFSASALPEMSSLYTCYNSILSVFGVDNLDGYLANRSIAGMGSTKYADIYLENFYYASAIRHRPFQDYLSIIKTDDDRAEEFIDTFIHEFVHTCEQSYKDGTIMNFHRAFYSNYVHMNNLQAMRLYLLCEIEYNGEIGGIPKSFWTERADKLLELNCGQAMFFAMNN